MTRTDAIVAAVRRFLEARRAELDGASDLRSLTLVLKFSPDHLEPRAVIDSIEREERRDGR